MKAKDRRQLERLTEQERKESGISFQDARRLIEVTRNVAEPTDRRLLEDLHMEQCEQM